jgi:hypothetical protein
VRRGRRNRQSHRRENTHQQQNQEQSGGLTLHDSQFHEDSNFDENIVHRLAETRRNFKRPVATVAVQFDKEASQACDYCAATAALRAARPDPSLRKRGLLRMTTQTAPYHCAPAVEPRFSAVLASLVLAGDSTLAYKMSSFFILNGPAVVRIRRILKLPGLTGQAASAQPESLEGAVL